MINKYIFNEDIKRVFNCIINNQIITQYILKDYISDFKIINDNKKKEKILENNSINLNNNNSKIIDSSSQNLITLASKNNTTTYPIINVNNSFLYFNSSLLGIDKLEGLMVECKWKNKYILLLKIMKINNSEKFSKTIEIECIEMNHFENAFNLEITLFWDSTAFQTLLIVKIVTINEIIKEIINRELNEKDKQIIYNNMCNYLFKDLTDVEHCLTSIIFANMKEISSFLSDIRNIIKLSPGTDNKRIEIYKSPLISSGQNCRVYDINSNQVCQEFLLSGYYVKKNRISQMRWEKKVNNKSYCIYRLAIIYLEENLSLIVLRNVWMHHVPRQLLSDVNNRKIMLFEEMKNFFIKKNGLRGIEAILNKNEKDIKLKIGVKNYKKNDENPIDLDMIIQTEGLRNSDAKKYNKENEYDSLSMSISNNANVEDDNLLTNTIQDISEIENMNSNMYLVIDEDKL